MWSIKVRCYEIAMKINMSKSVVTGDDEANERKYQQISGRHGAPARGLSRPSSGGSDAPNTLHI